MTFELLLQARLGGRAVADANAPSELAVWAQNLFERGEVADEAAMHVMELGRLHPLEEEEPSRGFD